jgi:hypothetical protein
MSDKPRYAHNSTLRAPSKEMARFNPEKRARRESEGLVYGPLHVWTKTQPCILAGHELHVCEFYGDRKGIESHHVKSVGSGGQDENNVLPTCPALHDEFHRMGLVSMCERYRMDFRSIACEVTARYERETMQGEDE